MEEIVICSAFRTAIAKFQGSLCTEKSPKIAAAVIQAILAHTKLNPALVDEVLMGNVLQAGLGQNPARQAAIWGGIPDTVGSTTINKVCGSGLKSVMLAAQAIKAKDANAIIAGGMENMSQSPYILRKARDGFRMGHAQVDDSMVADGLWDVYNDFHMGSTAELVAREYNVTRKMQDEYALNSQKKASDAQKNGLFKKEIVPYSLVSKKGTTLFEEDEGIRHDATIEGFAKLKPAFEKDGSVTAANASTINDGASALLVTSKSFAKENNLPILATIKAYATGGMAPQWVMMAPVDAIEKLLKKAGCRVKDIDLWEINEAFAAASVAIANKLTIDPSRVNVNGGAIALGHPIGASGARILVTLLHAMEQKQASTGVAALCLGGGNAVALMVEKK